MTYQLYIGADNATKELEIHKIEQVLALNHKGFTIQKALGYWQGEKELTAVVTVDDDKAKIFQTAHRLKLALNQDAIAVQKVNDMEFV